MECHLLASNWETLSTYMGLGFSLIDRIKVDIKGCQECWNEALKEWICLNYNHGRYGEPSWQTLLRAVAVVNQSEFKKNGISTSR